LVGGAIFLSGGVLATPIAALSGVPLLGGMSYGTLAALGLGLALTGASTLLTKPAGPSTEASNALNVNGGNIGNSGKQGDAVPLIYGECLVGSTPVEAWSDVEDISVYADNAGSIETAFGENG
jgi:predicted phage tail protein